MTAPHTLPLDVLGPLVPLAPQSWESDDLTNSGPLLPALTAFTGLRMLSLSCTLRTLNSALPGGLPALAAHLPFCHMDLVGGAGTGAGPGGAQEGGGAAVEEVHE